MERVEYCYSRECTHHSAGSANHSTTTAVIDLRMTVSLKTYAGHRTLAGGCLGGGGQVEGTEFGSGSTFMLDSVEGHVFARARKTSNHVPHRTRIFRYPCRLLIWMDE